MKRQKLQPMRHRNVPIFSDPLTEIVSKWLRTIQTHKSSCSRHFGLMGCNLFTSLSVPTMNNTQISESTSSAYTGNYFPWGSATASNRSPYFHLNYCLPQEWNYCFRFADLGRDPRSLSFHKHALHFLLCSHWVEWSNSFTMVVLYISAILAFHFDMHSCHTYLI